jgi:hypothetical protein
MIIKVFEPPPERATGGLDAAIRSIERYLLSDGWNV